MKIAKQQVTLIDSMGTDLSVCNAARVSFDKESEWDWDCKGEDATYDFVLASKDAKLIKYLAKHNHKSPFNHCFASFRVKAPIFIARQLVKHEYMPWNEVSRRYVDSEPEFYFPDVWRAKAENVKQGSSDTAVVNTESVQKWMEVSCFEALAVYEAALDNGVCAEQARMVLPQNTMTEWIWSGSLFAIAKMCKLRLDSHAQKEAQEVAQMVADEMTKLYPVSWAALMEN